MRGVFSPLEDGDYIGSLDRHQDAMSQSFRQPDVPRVQPAKAPGP